MAIVKIGVTLTLWHLLIEIEEAPECVLVVRGRIDCDLQASGEERSREAAARGQAMCVIFLMTNVQTWFCKRS